MGDDAPTPATHPVVLAGKATTLTTLVDDPVSRRTTVKSGAQELNLVLQRISRCADYAQSVRNGTAYVTPSQAHYASAREYLV